MSIYKGQKVLTVSLDMEISLTGFTVSKIKYKDPTGKLGEWEATKNGTKVEYELQASDSLKAGTYIMQAYVEDSSGRGVHGDPVDMLVTNTSV